MREFIWIASDNTSEDYLYEIIDLMELAYNAGKKGDNFEIKIIKSGNI